MRITIPEPDITLYEDGFEEHDILERAATGKRLSELIGRIDDPLVIALDGAWGSGKTVFLKLWCGEHLKSAPDDIVVYFDAFEHDFMDDPLISLVGAIGERVGKTTSGTAKAVTMIKNIAPVVGRASFRAAVSAATLGIVSRADDLFDAAVESLGDDLSKAASTFWKQEEGKRAAMQAFRTALTGLTEPDDKGTPSRKLIIVIDELDRCRPDYALSLLEVIKHFFTTPGVTFILGTNLDALANSVRARYGEGIDAQRYLQKFYKIRFPLPNMWETQTQNAPAQKYWKWIAEEKRLGSDQFKGALRDYIALASIAGSISLRDVEQIVTRAILTPCPENPHEPGEWLLVAGLVCLSVLRPDFIEKLERQSLTMEELSSVFHFELATSQRDGSDRGLGRLWGWLTKEPSVSTKAPEGLFPRSGVDMRPGSYVTKLKNKYLGDISIVGI